jgi:DNA-binding transcriptional ArsR family regulator
MSTTRNSTKRSYANAAALVSMIKILQDHPLSKRELSDKLGVVYETASKWVKLLYSAKLVYIAEWRRSDRGLPSARYEWNNNLGIYKDAPRPIPFKSTEYYKKYYEKKKGRLQEYLLTKKTES